MGGRRVFVGHGVVFFNDPRPHATIHGRPQAEIDSVSIRYRVSLPTHLTPLSTRAVRKMQEQRVPRTSRT